MADSLKENDSAFREKELKWNGWGYNDAYFFLNKRKEVEFNGERHGYDISGQILPHLRPWMISRLGIDLDITYPAQISMDMEYMKEVRCEEFLHRLMLHNVEYSDDKHLRVARAHGQTMNDVMRLRHGKFNRIPDVVVWPKTHNDVVNVVESAKGLPICIIPIAGGTSVSAALECPENEERMIVSLDVTKMNKVIWVDPKTMTVRTQGGIRGIDLEAELNAKGLTLGHEPDSVEFSTVAGWIATRASGMKKNKYGNIEDILVHVTFVTPLGVMQKNCQVPRISCGPDTHHFILGSEGTLGVVTEATLKVWPLPECKQYGSIIFKQFEHGVEFMAEVAKQHCAPASLRLVDNEQFIFGQALKPSKSYTQTFLDGLKKLYVTKWKGFDPNEMCVATLVFEGTRDEVRSQEERIYKLARKFGGLPAGAENGRYGYMLTFAIAYLRDLGFNYGILGESFETSVPWDRVLNCCNRVRSLCYREAERLGVMYPVFVSSRITQVYDTGACIYFYFGFNYRGLNDPIHVYEEIETAAREEILACGGSISHHHGVGKLRKKWLPQTIGEVGLSALRAVKNHLDPDNIFGSNNLFTVSKL